MAVRRIGQIFVDLGYIDDDQLEMLLEEQRQNPGELLGKIAEEMGLISDEQVVQALAEQMGLQTVDLTEVKLPQETLSLVSDAMAQLYRVIPLQLAGNTLTVATCDPQNLQIVDELRTFLGYDIEMVVSTEHQV